MTGLDDNQLVEAIPLRDGIGIARWFGLYAAFAIAASAMLAWQLQQSHLDWSHISWAGRGVAFHEIAPSVKLLIVLLYLSACTTLLPLPTGWIVTALATHEVALASGLWTTTLLVASIGAAGSTIANLNDYHLFTWMLRSSRVSKIRDTRFYDKARRWFDSSPFFILVVFNVLPIPIDVIRLLAITCRYGRWHYATANFIGRFIRYGLLAFATYYFNLGWLAPVAMLGIAAVLVLGKGLHSGYGRLRATSRPG